MNSRKTEDLCSFDKLFAKNVPYLLEKIFFSLDYEAYKTSLEVSTAWKDLLTSESFLKKGESVFKTDIRRDEARLLVLLGTGDQRKMEKVIRILSTGMVRVSGHGYGYGPLHVAAYAGDMDAAKLLLENWANPNIRGAFGYTPISLAVIKGHTNVVKL